MAVKLHVITTGGTIDKIYFDANSEFEIGDPVIGELLQRVGVGFDFTVESLMRKDSLELTDADRQTIREAVAASQAQCILLTHGTDTMVETGKVLAAIPDKRIVLTGALQPAAFHQSDAIFNIGCAIGALQTQPPGVYIAMNGLVLEASKAVKNRAKNRFEAVS